MLVLNNKRPKFLIFSECTVGATDVHTEKLTAGPFQEAFLPATTLNAQICQGQSPPHIAQNSAILHTNPTLTGATIPQSVPATVWAPCAYSEWPRAADIAYLANTQPGAGRALEGGWAKSNYGNDGSVQSATSPITWELRQETESEWSTWQAGLTCTMTASQSGAEEHSNSHSILHPASSERFLPRHLPIRIRRLQTSRTQTCPKKSQPLARRHGTNLPIHRRRLRVEFPVAQVPEALSYSTGLPNGSDAKANAALTHFHAKAFRIPAPLRWGLLPFWYLAYRWNHLGDVDIKQHEQIMNLLKRRGCPEVNASRPITFWKQFHEQDMIVSPTSYNTFPSPPADSGTVPQSALFSNGLKRRRLKPIKIPSGGFCNSLYPDEATDTNKWPMQPFAVTIGAVIFDTNEWTAEYRDRGLANLKTSLTPVTTATCSQ